MKTIGEKIMEPFVGTLFKAHREQIENAINAAVAKDRENTLSEVAFLLQKISLNPPTTRIGESNE